MLSLEIWVVARWLILKALATCALSLFGKTEAVENQIIKIGNVIFGQQFPLSMYQSYDSYVASYPCSLNPYFSLFDKAEWLDNRVVLDLGSGLGQYSALLARHGAKRVISVEHQYAKVQWARSHFSHWTSLSFVSASAEALPFKECAYDTAFAHTVFEHIGNVRNALKCMVSALKEGGVIMMSVNYIHHRGGHHLFPYIHFPWAPWIVSESTLCEYWSDRLANDQKRGLMKFFPKGCRIQSLNQGDEIHLNKINFDEFESCITTAGLKIIKRVPSESIARLLPIFEMLSKYSSFFSHLLNRYKCFLTGTVYYALAKMDPDAH